MKAFVATSIQNSQEALRVIKILEDLSIEYQCCITEKENMQGKELFDHNIKGIKNSDIFISVLKNLGRDVSTEIGIAHALGKQSIGVAYNIRPEDVMSYYASGDLVNEENLESLLKKIVAKDAHVAFSDFSQHKFSGISSDIHKMFSSKIFVDGTYTKQLEKKLSERYVRRVIATNSGTTALILALDVLLKDKKEVIVPSLTFNATIQAIIHAGGKPVFADVNKHTWTLDSIDVYNKISANTGAILPVNLFGVPSDIKSFKELSKNANIPLIYDSCQAFGAITPHGEIGTFGDIEAFSLDATKVLSGGLGGFITINTDELYEQLKYAKNFGNDYEKRTLQLGVNGRLSEFNAILTLDSLETVDMRLSKIRINVLKYRDTLSTIPHIEFQSEQHGTSAPQYFGIFINYNGKDVAQKIKNVLKDNGVETRIYNPTLLHKLKFFTDKDCVLPNTESMHSRILCLPTHEKITDINIAIVADTLRRYVK